ncbi:Beta-arrestin-1 [Schistosoma japonicum]|nr:Beta-arrestin-1 [Schistosoma japonicum]KAH8855560.1 Beta-arrestin-1 [Schistosoma japonicum]
MMQNLHKTDDESSDYAIKANKELHGVVVAYFVRVRCWIGIGFAYTDVNGLRPIECRPTKNKPIEVPYEDQD